MRHNTSQMSYDRYENEDTPFRCSSVSKNLVHNIDKMSAANMNDTTYADLNEYNDGFENTKNNLTGKLIRMHCYII